MYGSFGGKFYQYRLLEQGDAACYIKMAEHTFAQTENPFALRILTPLVVHIIKKNSNQCLGWDFTWYLVTFSAIFGSAVIFYKFLHSHLKLDRLISTFFTLFLLHTFCYTQFHFQDPFRVDPLNNLLWMAALYSLFKDKYLIFCLIVTIGFTNKEVILLLAPLYPIFMIIKNRTLWHRDTAVSVLAVGAIFSAYFIYRTVLTNYIGVCDYAMLSAYDYTPYKTLTDAIEHQKDLYAIFNVFSFLWIMFFYGLYEIFKKYGWRNRYLISALYLCAALLFGRIFARDANRVFSMMAPLVIAVAALFFSACIKSRRHLMAPVLLLAYASINLGWIPQKEYQIMLCIAVLWMVATGYSDGCKQLELPDTPDISGSL
jgi:hypothetical protein